MLRLASEAAFSQQTGRIAGPMSFGIGDGQLSLADPNYAAENEQFSTLTERV